MLLLHARCARPRRARPMQAAALEGARKEAASAAKAFLHIQQQRTSRFNAAFNHIK